MASDIEIAQAATPKPITEIAEALNIPDEALEPPRRAAHQPDCALQVRERLAQREREVHEGARRVGRTPSPCAREVQRQPHVQCLQRVLQAAHSGARSIRPRGVDQLAGRAR